MDKVKEKWSFRYKMKMVIWCAVTCIIIIFFSYIVYCILYIIYYIEYILYIIYY